MKRNGSGCVHKAWKMAVSALEITSLIEARGSSAMLPLVSYSNSERTRFIAVSALPDPSLTTPPPRCHGGVEIQV